MKTESSGHSVKFAIRKRHDLRTVSCCNTTNNSISGIFEWDPKIEELFLFPHFVCFRVVSIHFRK
ncbi:hypothetical protein TSMEX_008938 [Taenia solium]|eukprot:TsM_000363600 transcript=TsM_000363600 gene=TsM_000363600